MRSGLALMAVLVAAFLATDAKAFDLTDDLVISGYADARAVAPADPKTWLEGGLGKFRYGGAQNFGTEGVLQAELGLNEDLHLVSVLRAEPETPSVIDALETYLRYDQLKNDLGWSVKAGGFFPTMRLENDGIRWNHSS